MQKHDYAFTYTKYVRMKENGELTNGVSEAPKKLTYNQLMKHCVIGCLTVMLDREKIGEARMVNIRTRQDYAFWLALDRKSTRLNSSHVAISYAVFCLKEKIKL